MLRKAARIIRDAKERPEWIEQYWEHHRDRIASDIELVNRLPGRIADIGAMPYFTTLALHLAGRDIVAIDLDPQRLPMDDIEVLACNIEYEPLPLDDASVDVVLFSEVFEHLRIDLLHTVRELRRILSPSGRLLVTTPNLWSVRGIVRLLLRRQAWAINADPAEQYARLDRTGHMGHVREYTAPEVAGVLRTCGFEVERVVWRSKTGPRLIRLLERFIPPMRPYMTLVASPV